MIDRIKTLFQDVTPLEAGSALDATLMDGWPDEEAWEEDVR